MTSSQRAVSKLHRRIGYQVSALLTYNQKLVLGPLWSVCAYVRKTWLEYYSS